MRRRKASSWLDVLAKSKDTAGDVITISAPNVSSSTDFTIASISGGTLYLNASYIDDVPGVSNAIVATVSGLSSQIRGQNVYLTRRC